MRPTNSVPDGTGTARPVSDPDMRDAYFLRESTVIADIVDHIFATSKATNRPDSCRVFVDGDLPSGRQNLPCQRIAEARGALHLLDLDPSSARRLPSRSSTAI